MSDESVTSVSGTERDNYADHDIRTDGGRSPVGSGNQVSYPGIAKCQLSTLLTEVRQHRGIALVVDQHSLGRALATSCALHTAITVCYMITRSVANNQTIQSANATRSDRDCIVPDGGQPVNDTEHIQGQFNGRSAGFEPAHRYGCKGVSGALEPSNDVHGWAVCGISRAVSYYVSKYHKPPITRNVLPYLSSSLSAQRSLHTGTEHSASGPENSTGTEGGDDQ